MKSDKSAKRIQPRQKSSDVSANDRVSGYNSFVTAQRMADFVTKKYPMRQWAMWTHHQKHGWWSHVIAGNFGKIRFTWRDYDDLRSCWQRCKDEERFDHNLLIALDNIKTCQTALDVAVEAVKALVRRKA